MEDVRFFQQQANRCYQLAWQSFDLWVAQKLNRVGNEHRSKARVFYSEQTDWAPDKETGRSTKPLRA
jgi:hypothetical protein